MARKRMKKGHLSFLACEKCGINKVEIKEEMDKLTKMSEADEIIRKLNTEQRNYLNRYFAHAPESVTGSTQVTRMSEGTTFIQEVTPVDKVSVLLKGCVSAVDYRVRETVYGFCHFDPIETFGTMEILGHMNRYRTTLATTRDSLFLKIPRDAFEKWILKDVDALQMETERIIGYLLDQSRKERLYVLLPGNERVYLILANLYETYGKFDTYSVYMSRKDFSEVTGLSERTITRALKELEEKKLITRNGWNIVMTWKQYKQIKELMKDQINEMGE